MRYVLRLPRLLPFARTGIRGVKLSLTINKESTNYNNKHVSLLAVVLLFQRDLHMFFLRNAVSQTTGCTRELH